MYRTECVPGADAHDASTSRDLSRHLDTAQQLVESAEPAVVFSSLARLYVPDFCDSCVVDVVECETTRYRVSYPRDDAQHAGQARAADANDAHGGCVDVTFRGGGDALPYSGTARFGWRAHSPGQTDHAVAEQLVDRAVALIAHERLEQNPSTGRGTSTSLNPGGAAVHDG